MTSIKDLLKDLLPDEILQDFLDLAANVGLSTKGWQTGGVVLGLFDIFSGFLSSFINAFITPALRAQFLDYASGSWLTLVAFTLYGVSRREATFATGSVTLENRGGNFYSFSAGDIRITNADTNKTCLNTTGGTLAPWPGVGDYPTLTLVYQADEIGIASNAAIGKIAAYPTPLALGPADVFAVTNGEAFLAEDEEGDEPLKARCRSSTGPSSPAPSASAYESIALATKKSTGGKLFLPGFPGYDTAISVNVTRVRVVDAGGGALRVWLASASGAAAGDPFTAGSDVFMVNAALQLYVVPAGLGSATVAAATENACTYTVTVYLARGLNVTAAEAQAAAEDAITAYFATLPIGGNRTTPGGQGYAYASEVQAKAATSFPGIVKATVVQGDTALAEGEVAVPAISVSVQVVTQ